MFFGGSLRFLGGLLGIYYFLHEDSFLGEKEKSRDEDEDDDTLRSIYLMSRLAVSGKMYDMKRGLHKQFEVED